MSTSPVYAFPNRALNCADEFARRKPARAVAAAFGFGVVLNFLPLGAIFGMLAGLFFTAARPLLLVLGLLKLVDFTRSTSSNQRHD
jgi:hypothetical protein